MQKPIIYNGESPYIFISYSHKNTEMVWDILLQLQRDGYRFWYYDSLDAGSSWDDMIVEIDDRVKECGYFIAFISKDYTGSDNCVQEVKFALAKRKPVLVVYLDDVEPEVGLQMRLCTSTAIYYSPDDEPTFYEKLGGADGISEFRTTVDDKKKARTYKELDERCTKVMRQSCYCESLFTEHEMMDACLTACLYHLGLIVSPDSVKLRGTMREFVCAAEASVFGDDKVNCSIAGVENKLFILKSLLRASASSGYSGSDRGISALVSRCADCAGDSMIPDDAEQWCADLKDITADMLRSRKSVFSENIAVLSMEGQLINRELYELLRKLRRGNKVRKAMNLKIETL